MKSWLKSNAFGAIAAVLLVAALLIAAGCGQREEKVRTHPQDLQTFSSKLDNLQAYETFDLVKQAYGAGENSVFLEVRKKVHAEQTVTDQEKEEIAEAIFAEIGFRVPLELHVQVIGETPAIKGKLTAIDGNRFLIVATSEADEDDNPSPDAKWFTMAEDGVVIRDGETIDMAALRIGYEVNGWTSGLEMTSYPSQVSGLKVEVTGEGTANTGDLSGIVEEITFGQQDWSQNVIIVDGQTYGIGESTRVIKAEGDAALSDVQAGSSVLVWFAGYGTGLEGERKMVTQILIQS